MSRSAMLEIDDVTVGYGSQVVVDGLCLEVAGGEVFGLLGPNGCGKSTTLSAVVGALPPLSGVIRIAGRCASDDPIAYRRLIGLVPQELALYEDLSVERNLSFFGRLYGLRGPSLRNKVGEVLDFVCLSSYARRVVRTLSGGMQRRLNLACALLHDPVLLLLDEPTVGLDIASRDDIFASLRNLREGGRALVFTTHHLHEAEVLCDRIGIMDRGQLLVAGTLDELRDEWGEDRRDTLQEDRRDKPGGSLERVFLELTGRGTREQSRRLSSPAPAASIGRRSGR